MTTNIHRLLIPGHPNVTIECDNVAQVGGTTYFYMGTTENWHDGYGYTVVARLVGPVLVIPESPVGVTIHDLY